jgi:hypothetical protein
MQTDPGSQLFDCERPHAVKVLGSTGSCPLTRPLATLSHKREREFANLISI